MNPLEKFHEQEVQAPKSIRVGGQQSLFKLFRDCIISFGVSIGYIDFLHHGIFRTVYWYSSVTNGLFCCSIISKLFFSSVTRVFTSKDSRGPAADGLAGMCPNYSRSWSLTSQSHILSIAYLNYNGFCPIISGLGPGDQFHYLARLPGAPSPPPPNVITTQLLQITAARALFVMKLEQRQCEPAAISASNYLLRASCLIDPNWRDRRPRSGRGRRGFFGPQNTPRNRSCGCNGYKRDNQRHRSLKGDKIKVPPGETRYQTETYNHSGETTVL